MEMPSEVGELQSLVFMSVPETAELILSLLSVASLKLQWWC